jgi:hypothetical protein
LRPRSGECRPAVLRCGVCQRGLRGRRDE